MMFSVTAYFNDATGGSFAPGVNPESDERYENIDRRAYMPMWDGYDPEHAVLVSSSIGTLQFDASTPQGAAEQMFEFMNRDSRPNGQVERSLSVGDVVKVEAGETVWLAVDNVGFKRIEQPENI